MIYLFIFILIAFWYCWKLLNNRLYGDAFSPLNLLFYFWILPFVLSLSNASELQSGLEVNAIVLILIVTIILIATSLLPAFMGVTQNFKASKLDNNFFVDLKPILPLMFFIATFLALYYAEFYDKDLPLYEYLTHGEVNSSSHVAGKDSKLQVLAYGIHSVALIFFFFYLKEVRSIRRKFYLFLSILPILIGLMKGSKSDVFISLYTISILLYYHRKINVNKIPVIFLILLLILGIATISITSFRLDALNIGERYANLIKFNYEDYFGDVGNQFLAIIYGYSALGFQNFSNYVNFHSSEFRLGTSFFRPFLSIFMRGYISDELGVPVDQWNVISPAANTGTFLTPLYVEGGAIMCFFGALIYGLMVNISYTLFRLKGALVFLFIYVSLLFSWSWLFFTNAFSSLSVYTNIFYIFILLLVCIKDRKGSVMENINPKFTA